MAITIYSNISSLNAQRRLGQSTADLRRSFERLSSGLRINRAADDAAGLAIAENLNMQSRVYAQGVRNLNDGISALQIADSAVAELTNVVTRIRELSEQSANGTITNKQRAAINEEAQALSQEATRIIQTTEFNGSQILMSGYGELSLQAGFGEQGVIESDLGGAVGDGTLSAEQLFGAGNSIYSVSVGDLNGDGSLDIVTANYGSSDTSVLIGNGDGTFTAAQTFGAGSSPQSVSLGDLNGDGALDIVTANRFSNETTVLLGNGDGTFAEAQEFGEGFDARSVSLGDVDGDGTTDIVTANGSSDYAAVFLGNGDGTLAASQTFGAGNVPLSVSLGDISGDGVLDIVLANYTSADVSVLLGIGDGTFAAAQTIEAGNSAYSVSLGDVNGDGTTDIVTANGASSNTTVLLGNGDGTFSSAQDFELGSHAISVSLGDMNGDGALDIVTANYSGGDTVVLLGNGDGTFAAAEKFGGTSSYIAVSLGDVNGDGVLDVVAASYGDGAAAVLLGNTTTGTAPILPFSLETKADALQSMSMLDNKLVSLGEQRAKIGAFISRVETAINVTSITAENLKAAESQIRDADIAFESAELVRKQILQQAGAAVLTQANQQPQLALQLLGGI